MDAPDELERGREAHDARRWEDAAAALALADAGRPLEPADLELLATALFMIGREQERFEALERAYQGHIEAGAPPSAAYCAFWIGMPLLMRGDVGRGGGWLARAHRLLESESDCRERGYLLLPEVYRRSAEQDVDGALAAGSAALESGRRFGDADLFALAAHAQGQILLEHGRLPEGLGLLDEAMLAVCADEVSPMPTGIIYCGSIDGCRTAFEPRRAREWTDALHAWCESQPDLLAFTGDCHVHRAEVLQLSGAWDDASEALDRAGERAARAGNTRVGAYVAYRRGEILRLRGELAHAEAAYREAAGGGHEPQPGLALLRLAQGDAGAAVAAIRRVLVETEDPARRAGLLPAYVEILLAARDRAAAEQACAELEEISTERACPMTAAMAAQARGAVALSAGDARGALQNLRRSLTAWHEIGAPYEAARVQLMVAQACHMLGDEDSASIDAEAAHEALHRLGAASEPAPAPDTYGLTERELQVLRLLATGATNRAIAGELILSERTVDRHVSNIYSKLRVSSRATATAFAYEHRLL